MPNEYSLDRPKKETKLEICLLQETLKEITLDK